MLSFIIVDWYIIIFKVLFFIKIEIQRYDYPFTSRWGFCDDSNDIPIETGEHIRHRYFTVETTVLSEKYVQNSGCAETSNDTDVCQHTLSFKN